MKAPASGAARACRTAVTLGATAIVVVLSGGPAAADVTAVNQETVVVRLDPDGRPQEARVLSQLTATGKGKVLIEDPTSTEGLRSLDGFTAPSVTGDKARYTLDVDGRETRRMIADY